MRFFAASLILHILLLTGLWLRRPKPATNEPPFVVTLEDTETDPPPREPVPPSQPPAKKSSSKTKPPGPEQAENPPESLNSAAPAKGASQAPPQIGDLRPSLLQVPAFDQQGQQYNHGSANLQKADNPAAPWGEGGGEYGRIVDYSRFERVAHYMDHIVEFPYQLAYRRRGGVINTRVVMDDQGRCHWGESFVRGNDPLLRFYVLTLLKQFCRSSVWRGIRKRKSSNIDFSFHFDLYLKEEVAPMVNGNVVLFKLPGYQDRGNWRAGPVQGHFMFPTFILLNPTWVVEQWNQIVHDEDPLERFQGDEEELLGLPLEP
jgi:hypothetical protein